MSTTTETVTCRHCGHPIHESLDSPTRWSHYVDGHSIDWWHCWAPGRNPLIHDPDGATP